MSEKKGSSGEKLLYCSFCGKSQHEVKKLIAGPSVFICDECIDLCNEIIRDEAAQARRTEAGADEIGSSERRRKSAKFSNQYVIGQQIARSGFLSVAVYNHYKRLKHLDEERRYRSCRRATSCSIGPTGSGKTLLAQTLARHV